MSVLLVNIRLFTLLSTSQKHGRENLHHLRASLTGHKWPAGRSRGGKSTASEGTAGNEPVIGKRGKGDPYTVAETLQNCSPQVCGNREYLDIYQRRVLSNVLKTQAGFLLLLTVKGERREIA